MFSIVTAVLLLCLQNTTDKIVVFGDTPHIRPPSCLVSLGQGLPLCLRAGPRLVHAAGEEDDDDDLKEGATGAVDKPVESEAPEEEELARKWPFHSKSG